MKSLKTIYITLLMVFMVLFGIETTWAQPEEATFNFTGGQQSFVVPPGVNTINIQAWGAQGADASVVGLGGLGGFAQGNLTVTPGQTLEIFVGGQGTPVDDQNFGGGGFNGGGDARGGNNIGNERGGGGGASDVRAGGTEFSQRVIVAAGGGGASGTETRFGGAGGGLTGGDGGVETGFGGTQTTGGLGAFPSCLDGEFGLGGDSSLSASCAGGGGGWYGGGGGAGAGGGSSYIDGVENGSTTPGLREGDGLIILSYTPVATSVPTLSEWGLISMAGLLGIVGFMVIRRRQVTA